MKAVALHFKDRQVRVLDVPSPTRSRPTDVLVKTLEVGVCGTDKEIVEMQHGSAPEGSDYLIVGHEALGEVLEVGPEVKGLAVGDLVVPRVRRPCPHAHCSPCREARPDFCVTGEYTERGIQGAHGFMSEQFVEDAAYLHKVPSLLRSVAVLTEPLTIAEKSLDQVKTARARIPGTPGQKCVVLGAGTVGQLGVMAFQVAGYDVTVYSRAKQPNTRASVAEAFGAPYVSAEQVTPEQLREQVGAPDVVYEAAGSPQAAFDLLRVLAINGTFVFTGVPGKGKPLPLNTAELMRDLVLGNRLVLGTVNASGEHFRSAIDDLGRFRERWGDKVEELITSRHPPEDFEALATGKIGGGVKNIIEFR